jgi:ribonuclease HI
MKFTVYTDGGCSGNRRDSGCIGGYGYIILDPAKIIIAEGGGKGVNTTNNMMEMTAVIKGLKVLKEILDNDYSIASKHDCVVVTDSKYVCENFVDYLPDWRACGWRKANGGAVLNKELWKEMYKTSLEFNTFQFKWVKGHAKDRLNERADAIVQRYMR